MAESSEASKENTLPLLERDPDKSVDESSCLSDASDDWFNKSFDDFELPTGNNRDSEEEEECGQQEQSVNVNTIFNQNSTKSGSTTACVKVAQSAKKKEKKKSIPKAHGKQASQNTNEGRRKTPRTDERRGEENKNCRVEEEPVLTDVGVLLRVHFDSHQLLQLQVDVSDSQSQIGDRTDTGQIPEVLDEDWFQKVLENLPTVLKHPQIHSICKEFLEEAQDQQTDAHFKLVDDVSDEEDSDEGIFSQVDLQVKLQRSKEGDFTRVKRRSKETAGWETANRSNFASNFRTIIKYLLATHKSGTEAETEAETEAYRVARKYPLSCFAISNLFYILWKNGNRSQAAHAVKPLLELRNRNKQIYQRILYEDEGELGRCYTELRSQFLREAIMAFQTTLQQWRPQWYLYLFLLALNVRRTTTAQYNLKNPVTDFVSPLQAAFRWQMIVFRKAEEDNDVDMKVAAASELSEILSLLDWDEGQASKTALDQMKQEGEDAAYFLNIVGKIEEKGGPNVWRAGKRLRYSHEINKSKEILETAVAWPESGRSCRVLHLHDTSKEHHHLALTLKKLARRERRRKRENFRRQPATKTTRSHHGPKRGESAQDRGVIFKARMQACNEDPVLFSFQNGMKVPIYEYFSRDDLYVKKAMEHFHKALVITKGKNSEVSYDLGLMYKSLEEYSDALQQLLLIVSVDAEPVMVIKAMEQCGLVHLEMCSQKDKGSTASIKQEQEGKALLAVTILFQSRIVIQFRKKMKHLNPQIWQSLYSLGCYLKLEQDTKVCGDDSRAELWLLRLMRVYADTVPVLCFIQQYKQQDDATDPDKLKSKLHKYNQDQRFEDTILFASLLHLTEQCHVLDACTDLLMKTSVQAARQRLLSDVKEERSEEETFNKEVAKRFFRWTFEDTYQGAADAHPMPVNIPGVGKGAHTSPNACQTVLGAAMETECLEKPESSSHPGRTVKANGNQGANLIVPSQQSLQADKIPGDTDKQTFLKAVDRPHSFTDEEKSISSTASTEEEGNVTTRTDRFRREEDDSPVKAGNFATKKDTTRTDSLAQRESFLVKTGKEGEKSTSIEDKNVWSALPISPPRHLVDDLKRSMPQHHVMIIHDPHDKGATSQLDKLKLVLQNTCGLRTHYTEACAEDTMLRATVEAMSHSQLLLVVLGKQDQSPQMERYISEATRRCPESAAANRAKARYQSSNDTLPVLLTLTLDGAVLPPSLQGYPTFSWRYDGQRDGLWVKGVCTLFSFIVGISDGNLLY